MKLLHEVAVLNLLHEHRPARRVVAALSAAQNVEVASLDADAEVGRVCPGDLYVDDECFAVGAQEDIAVRLEARGSRTLRQLDEHRVELREELIVAHGTALSSQSSD